MRYIYPETPQGKLGEFKIGYPPAKVALESNNNENIATSSVLSFTHDTTEIEVAAVGQGVAGRWAASQATSVVTATGAGANFDFVVPSGELRRFAVPISTNTSPNGSVMGVNRKFGLFQAVAYKTLAGNGSVLTMEF